MSSFLERLGAAGAGVAAALRGSPFGPRLEAGGALVAAYTWDNPVFLKEMRLYFRSNRTYLIHFAYLVLLSGLLAGLVGFAHLEASSGGRTQLWVFGQKLFAAVVGAHALFLAAMMSSLAAGTIASERETRTYEIIESLPLPMGMFVAGKFVSVVTLAGLIVLSSLPLLMMALSFVGGVTAWDVVRAFVGLTALAALFGSMGILASAVSLNSRAALILCGRICGLFVLLVPLVGVFAARLPGLGSSALTPGYVAAGLLVALFGAPLISEAWWTALLPALMSAGVSGLLLTAAADHLRPPNEKRPYFLLLQVFSLFCLLSGAYVASYIYLAGSHVATSAQPKPEPFSHLSFMMMQGAALACLSVLVLPTPETRAPGWRACFSSGPLHGAFYLLLSLAATNAVLLLFAPWISSASGQNKGMPTGLWLAGQGALAALVFFWAGLARLWLAAWPRFGRAAYATTLVALLLLPLLLQVLVIQGEGSFLTRGLLALNPWISLAPLDPKAGEGFFELLKIPKQTPLHYHAIGWGAALGAFFFRQAAWIERRRARPRQAAAPQPERPRGAA